MASVLTILVLAALAAKKGRASPTTNRSCVQIEVPVSIDTTAIKWLQPRVDSNIDAVDWVTNMTTWTSPNLTERMIGNVTVKQTFKINGQLCVPLKGTKTDVLQLATHGVGFDKRYWDAEINPDQYSYVHAALAAGYSIFTYDRLGTGASDKPDAYDIVQTSVQFEILRQLTSLARSGKLVSSSKKLNGSIGNHLTGYKPSKIIHIGHSLGSVITLAFIASQPSESDGVIATGFLHTDKLAGVSVATWGLEFARENDPVKFADRGSGYIVQATRSNTQPSFLKKGSFEEEMLDYAWEIRQPNTVSEFLSIGSVLGVGAGGFKGPLQFVIGEYDYGFCAGDCKGTYNVTGIKESFYPGATALEVHLQPGTGHGLTLSTNATAGYKVMFDFLHRSGL